MRARAIWADLLTRPIAKRLRELYIEVLTGAKARGLASKDNALSIEAAGEQMVTLAVDKILVTVGRKPSTVGWNLDAIDLDMDGPFIRMLSTWPKARSAMKQRWSAPSAA